MPSSPQSAGASHSERALPALPCHRSATGLGISLGSLQAGSMAGEVQEMTLSEGLRRNVTLALAADPPAV